MSIFKKSEIQDNKIDYQIATAGWCQLYKSRGIMGEDVAWLSQAGYEVINFECQGTKHLMMQFKNHFYFPDYFGNNWDALNDYLRDITIKGKGIAIVLNRLDQLKNEDAHILLGILVDHARLAFLLGNRLLILAQVDDGQYEMEKIGGTNDLWNAKEWLNSNRV